MVNVRAKKLKYTGYAIIRFGITFPISAKKKNVNSYFYAKMVSKVGKVN